MENLHPPGPGEWREATESHPSQRGRGRPGPHGREGKLRLKGQWRTPQACPGQQAHQGVGRGCSTHIRLGRAGDAGAALPPTSRSDSTEASSPLPLLFCSDRQGGFRGQWQVNYFTYGVLVRTGKERPGVTGCECGLRAYLASNTELS